MMQSVVTGGCGFIGSHLTELLLSKGHAVTVIDNLSTGRLENLQHICNPNLKIVQADISNPEAIRQYFCNVDYVFHLAALADIVPSIKDPGSYFHANVEGTLRVLECAKNSGIKKLVYAASSSCYGIPKQYPTNENSEIKPEYPYALTKRMGEELVLHWGTVYKLPVVSLRLFNVYGPRSRTSSTYGAVFGVFLAQKLSGKPFTIVGDGTQKRDFIYVTDIANAFYQAAVSDRVNEVYNVGSGKPQSINDLTDLLEGEKTYIPKRPGEPEQTYADVKKIKRDLNWSAEVSFEEGVERIKEQMEYWSKAPVWTPETIQEETKEWFQYLS